MIFFFLCSLLDIEIAEVTSTKFTLILATNAKRENPEHLENSELEVLRAKIRKLEQENFELKSNGESKD